MTVRPDNDWNGGIRELSAGKDHREESVYCTVCGNIYVPKYGNNLSIEDARHCPTCRLKAELDDLRDELGDGE